MIASYSKTAAFSLTYCNSRYLFMWRSRVLYACVYSRGEDASDLTFCSWKIFSSENKKLVTSSDISPKFGLAVSMAMIRLVWYTPDERCFNALYVVWNRFFIDLKDILFTNIVGACDEHDLWLVYFPCVHKSLQFVSLCEYALIRSGFGVYRRFAKQLWYVHKSSQVVGAVDCRVSPCLGQFWTITRASSQVLRWVDDFFWFGAVCVTHYTCMIPVLAFG